MKPVFLEVAAGDGNRFNGLIDCTGANGLNIRVVVLPNHAGDSASDGRGSRSRGDLDDVHRAFVLFY